MREIKFRAYHLRKKKMVKVADVNTCGVLCKPVDEHTLWAYADFKSIGRFKECELMQYTGLNDKNGKEIYEGDIVKFFRWSNDLQKPDWFVAPITFSVGQFFAEYQLFDAWQTTTLEIIGNIYENEDLLQKSN